MHSRVILVTPKGALDNRSREPEDVGDGGVSGGLLLHFIGVPGSTDHFVVDTISCQLRCSQQSEGLATESSKDLHARASSRWEMSRTSGVQLDQTLNPDLQSTPERDLPQERKADYQESILVRLAVKLYAV